MRLKKLAVLLVFVLCFSLVFITSQSRGDEQANIQLAGLNNKLIEIRDTIKMNLVWSVSGDIQDRLEGVFTKLVKANSFVLTKEDDTTTSDPSQIATHMISLKNKGVTYKTTSIAYQTLTETSTPATDPFRKDAKADIIIEFSYTENDVVKSGEMSFILYHMKRCIWD